MLDSISGTFGGFGDWSPDGKRIAFNGTESEGGQVIVFVSPIDGSGGRNVKFPHADVDTQFGAWSPDGTSMAITSTLSADHTASSGALVSLSIVEASFASVLQSNIVVLSEDNGLISGCGDGDYWENTPELDVWWSPDGRFVSYAARGYCDFGKGDTIEHEGFGFVGADGEGHRHFKDAISLAWSPDSSRFARLVSDGTSVKLIIEESATGESTTLSDVALALVGFSAPCERWTAWTADGIYPSKLPFRVTGQYCGGLSQ